MGVVCRPTAQFLRCFLCCKVVVKTDSFVFVVLRLINRVDCVFEIGGHIGYVTQIFEDLVDPEGNVSNIEFTKINC